MTQLARRCDRHVAVGLTQASARRKVAKEFPGVEIHDHRGTVDLPNVQSVTFRQASRRFCAGCLPPGLQDRAKSARWRMTFPHPEIRAGVRRGRDM